MAPISHHTISKTMNTAQGLLVSIRLQSWEYISQRCQIYRLPTGLIAFVTRFRGLYSITPKPYWRLSGTLKTIHKCGTKVLVCGQEGQITTNIPILPMRYAIYAWDWITRWTKRRVLLRMKRITIGKCTAEDDDGQKNDLPLTSKSK